MNSSCRHALDSYLVEIKDILAHQKSRLQDIDSYASYVLKVKRYKNGKAYYSAKIPGQDRYHYLGTESSPDVSRIKEAHYLALAVNSAEREIRLIEDVLRSSADLRYDAINSRLKKVYRDAQLSPSEAYFVGSSASADIARKWKQSMENYKKTFPPYRPEEKIHKTRDGTYVRSKNEALIYNYLLDIGVTFVYELPLRINFENKNSLLLPDFTILSEMDYKTVIMIEHQGKMNDPYYRKKFYESIYKYWLNNYIPERDVFFTFDLPNGGFDDTPITNIIRQHIRPGP